MMWLDFIACLVFSCFFGADVAKARKTTAVGDALFLTLWVGVFIVDMSQPPL